MFRIIIVDDEEMIQKGLHHLIEWNELNIEVVGFASNGREALDLIASTNPNIMLCDVRMPVMDGLELLKCISERNIDIHTILLSGFDDFTYVKYAMKYNVENYLLKPVDREELFSTLLNIIEKIEKNLLSSQKTKERNDIIRTNILNRLITNHINAIELEDKLGYLEIKLPEPPYRVVIAKLLEYTHKITRDDYDRESSIVENSTDEILSAANAGISFQTIIGNIVLILGGTSLSLDQVKALLEKCLSTVKRLTMEDVLLTVGRPVDELCQLYVSYEDARDLLDYRLIKVKDWIVFYEEETKKPELATLLNIDLGSFENSILNCHKDKAFEFIEMIYSGQTMQRSNIRPNQIISYFMSLIACCFNVARLMKINTEALLAGQEPIEKVMQNESGQDLSDWLKCFIVRIIDSINAKKQRGKTQIEDIVDYVNKKYEKDLSLQILANEFSISSPYLGTLFKNETGEIFSVYLNKLRVEKAKELLFSTNHSASEISKMVGYWDANYFYKIFKKYTGVFPTQFRSV